MTAIFGVLSQAQSLSDALADGAKNVERTSENITRVLAMNEQKAHL